MKIAQICSKNGNKLGQMVCPIAEHQAPYPYCKHERCPKWVSLLWLCESGLCPHEGECTILNDDYSVSCRLIKFFIPKLKGEEDFDNYGFCSL